MNDKSGARHALLSALFSIGAAAATAAAILMIGAAFLLLSEDPAALYFPVGAAALYAGALVGGFAAEKRFRKGPLSGLLCGVPIAVVSALCGLFVKSVPTGRPVLLTAALFLLIPAASVLGAYFAGKRKKKRPSMRKRPRRGVR